jgi:CheY-like chemotaxis protein
MGELLDELREVRRLQDEILTLLRERPSAPPSHSFGETSYEGEDDTSPGSQPVSVRSRRRKSVLIIDDDSVSRTVAADALAQADVPVRTVTDGNAGLAAIAQEKPDVVVLELGIAGAMPGKDVVNVIKATMEWVDVPIVLYTRVPIESQKEARTIHGADELVQKGPGAADLLVARVIAIFRKG